MSQNQFLKKIRHIVRNWESLDVKLLKKLATMAPSDIELHHYTTPPLNGSTRRAEIIQACHAANPFNVCIETGSWLGATTDFFASLPGQPIVHSAELNPAFHQFATMRMRHCPQVTVHLCSSENLLSTLDGDAKGQPCFIYLDAHWNDYLPLRDELEICKHWPQAIIMIDDFKVEGDNSFKYDDYGEVVGVLTLDYIKDQITDHAVYFPAFTAAEDAGAKSGFVILTTDPKSMQTLDDNPNLRRYAT